MDTIINHKRLDAEEKDIWRQLELQYRSRPKDARSDAGLTISTLAMLSFGSFIAMIVVRVLGANFLQPQGIILSTGIGFFVAFVIILTNKKAIRMAALTVLCAPFISILIGLLHYATQSVFLNAVLTIVVLLAAVWLADHIVHHYAAWFLADPRLPRDPRMARSEWYKCRRRPWSIAREHLLETTDPELKRVRTAELRRIRAYTRGFAVIFLLYAILPHLPEDATPGAWVFFVPPIYALFRIWRTCPPRAFFKAVRTSLGAFICWLTYGYRVTDAPGVFQSPFATLKRRTIFTAILFAVMALVVSPYVGYFSFFRALAGAHYEWKTEFDTSLNQQASLVGALASTAAPEDLVANALTEREFLRLSELRFPSFPLSDKQKAELEALEQKEWAASKISYGRFHDRFPLGWVFVALDAISRGKTIFLYPLTFSLLACLLFPFIVLWSILAAAGAGLLTHTRLAVHEPNAPECKEPEEKESTPWSRFVQRLQESENKREAAHLWLGTHIDEDYPVLLDRNILSEHAYLVGDSGSGKTTRGIIPLLVQLIRAQHGSMVIIDLKGDNALFQTVRQEAQNAGLTFKFFTNEMKKPTYSFNPFLQANPEHISLNQVCETMLEALNLNHGEGYGRSYYSRVARRWLSAILKSQPGVYSYDGLSTP